MPDVLQVTSGDVAGDLLRQSGVDGDILVWRDILYDGTRHAGWPENGDLQARALFLEAATGGGVNREEILATLRMQYDALGRAGEYRALVLWFDACLFDQSMLCHILACLPRRAACRVELLCVAAYPGIEPFDGLGQLVPEQLLALHAQRRLVTEAQFAFAARVDRAFAGQDMDALDRLSNLQHAPLPHVPAAAARWLLEQPDRQSGLGLLERLILQALRHGAGTPPEIMAFVAAHDRHPRYWGDTTLWAKINGLARRRPPPLRLQGPTPLLPQRDCREMLGAYSVTPVGVPPFS